MWLGRSTKKSLPSFEAGAGLKAGKGGGGGGGGNGMWWRRETKAGVLHAVVVEKYCLKSL